MRILVYNVLDGQLLHSLRAHTDNVYSIAYSPDGTKFASGGKDKAVIVWSSSCKGIFRYEHSDSVQRVSFSPRGDKLASTTNSEIGFYCVETKQIDKYSTPAKSLAATWSADGEILTVGMINGLVSFRSANGHQIGSIRRSAPISCLLWITAESELSGGSHNKDDKLAIGCWDKSISFYSFSGERAEEDCALQSTPLSIVRFRPGTDSILISCTNGKISLCSTNGVLLRDIYSETSWIWSVAYHPEHALVALGDNEGRIRLCNHPAKFPHDFDNGIFISSINFTSITVETSEHAQRYTINARTLVYDVSYYKSNLAFATAAAIFLYNVSLPNESSTLCCAFKTKIKGAYKADRLLVAEDFIMVATCCKIQCYSFDSSPRDTWLFDSNVTSLCLVEGFYGKLSILAGLSDGKVYLIKHDPRPELIFEMGIKVTSLQLDTKCNLLGVLTDKEYVAFDWSSREISFRASNVSTFVFHDSLSRLAAYVVNGKLFACHGKKSVEIAEIHNDAILLSFSDKCVVFAREFISQLFNIHVLYESLVDAHLMEKDLESASQLALFLNNADKLNRIGLEAIGSMNFVLARQCFCLSGSEDLNKYICKVEDQFQRHVPKTDLQLLAFAEQGEIAGRLGLYSDAVAYFLKAKNPERAVQVLINKNLWDEARTLATSQGCVSKEFLDECEVDYYIREEKWRDAVSLYLFCQKYTKAVDLIGKIKWEGWDVDLLELLKQLSLDNHWEAFQMCADLFRAANHVAQLKEVFLISRDYPALADLALQEGNRNDAILFFQKAGMKDELCETLELQAIEAARLDKFVDAALSYYRIEMQSYNNISSPSKCILFHGYQNVNDYCNNKLSLNIEPDAFVRLCMFQYNSLMKFDTPPSLISKSTVLLALAKQAVALGENEMARVALSELRPPYTPQNKRIKNEIQENLLLSKVKIITCVESHFYEKLFLIEPIVH